MKKILIAFCVLATTGAFAQSHEQGQIQINLDYELQVGTSTSVEVDGTDFDIEGIDVAIAGPRLDLQYGVAENISVGLAVRMATSTTSIDGFDGESKASHFDIGIEPRYYLINSDNMNVFGDLTVGLTTLNPDEEDGEEEIENASGLFYGVGAGVNYFFAEKIGANLRVGYGSRSYTEEDDFLGTTIETKSTFSGIDVGIGLTIKL